MKLYFEERDSWRRWLEENHDAVNEVWLVFFKKHTGNPCVEYGEALCFGWIDSLIKRLDDERYARKFTRRADTTKSMSNLKRIQKLTESGKMTGIGLAKVPSDVQPPLPVPERSLAEPEFLNA